MQPALAGDLVITDELTEFAFARNFSAWWIEAYRNLSFEYQYMNSALSSVSVAHTPLTLTDDGIAVAVHEAALVDYSSMTLRNITDNHITLKADLMPWGGANAGMDSSATVDRVYTKAPFQSPWRTIQIAPTEAALLNSSLILNLNEPMAAGTDTSYIKPGKYMGIWWEMHLDRKTWASGPKHGATNENVRKHIDFAAKHGFGGVLVEGWNVGWDGDWFGNGEDFSFTKSYPDFDLEALSAYARSKNVVLIGHHETSGNAAHYETQLGDAFDLYQRVGVPAVKTGYVADASQAKVTGTDGRRHYAWHEGQDMARHHLKVVTEAAKRHIAVNPHEPIKDSGLRRTYPNWISREGARGMEFSAWGQPGNPPEHEANLVFTRLLAGPMDYTPGIFGMKTRSTDGIATTWAKQLSLYVVIYSPLQMAADLLENYEKNPAPFQFIKDVPVDWDDTRVLNGEVGDYVTIARKERGGPNWYLGALTDEDGRTLSVPLSFLDEGRRYTAQIYRDGDKANWKTAPQDIVIEERSVTRGDTLTLRLAPGGGQAIRFVAQ